MTTGGCCEIDLRPVDRANVSFRAAEPVSLGRRLVGARASDDAW
jgi:hypothetical protein